MFDVFHSSENYFRVKILLIMKNTLLVFFLALLFLNGCKSKSENQSSDKQNISSESVADNDTTNQIDDYLTDLSAKKHFSGGLLIIQNGEKIFSKGYGWADQDKKIPFTTSTLASMGSITKLFTATAIMKLVEQGKIALDDPLKKFFPTVPNDKADITIHQLLTHSSGFHEFLSGDEGDYEKIETEAFLQRAFDEPLSFEPGTKAIYTNVGMSIVAIIVEMISGMDYETYLKQKLFVPIGIKHIGYQYPAENDQIIAHGYQNGIDRGTHQIDFENAGGGPYWNLKGNGGLQASLDEMLLWANAFTNKTILSSASIQEMFNPQIEEEGTNGQFQFGYGCNIFKSKRNTTVIDNGGSNGIYFARMLRFPQEGVVIYMVTNESTINTNMVLPNITQLYFDGKITMDAISAHSEFEFLKSKEVYELINEKGVMDFEKSLKAAGIEIDNDMVLLEVGEKLSEENNTEAAIAVYLYYTKTFPNIVVAWNDLGDLYLLKKQTEEAKKCYEQALKIRPENPRAKESLKNLPK